MTDASSGARFPDDPLGAFCKTNHAALKGSGAGPLAGLSFAVKDCFHIAGVATSFGQPDWLQTQPVPRVTAVVVQNLLDAGADMIAKAYCDELCYSLTGENVHYGTPVNVVAPGRVPGGSSNGSAAAVAGGLVDFAIGTDCGGSVRIPASYCGILGIRPTHGRIDLDGVIPFGPSFDVAGWFARDPGVFIRVGTTLLSEDTIDGRAQRLVLLKDAFELAPPAVRDALKPGIERLRKCVGQITELDVSGSHLADWFEVFKTVQASEVWANHGAWISKARPRLGPGVKDRVQWASKLLPQSIAEAKTAQHAIRAMVDEKLRAGDVLVLPTSPRVAPLVDSPVDKIEVEYREQAMRLLCISGLNSLPQISLPLASIDGLPLGLSISGPRGSDRALLDLAAKVMNA